MSSFETDGEQLQSLAEHHPSEGYYVYRGLHGSNEGDYYGPHWTQNFCFAYLFSNLGDGDFYVAHLSTEELFAKEGGLRFSFASPDEVTKWFIEDGAPEQFFLELNPDNARLVTSEEQAALFVEVWDELDRDAIFKQEGIIDQWERSKTVFGSKL